MTTRTKSSRKTGLAAIVSMLTISLTVLAGACSTSTDGVASPDAAVDGGPIARGAMQVVKRGCVDCHEPPDPSTEGQMSGSLTPRPGTQAYPANLTPDVETGIGSWTDDEVVKAMTLGVAKGGVPLCFTMPRFSNLDLQTDYDIAQYLRSLPPIHREIPASMCPPLKPRPDAGLDAAEEDASEIDAAEIDASNTDAGLDAD